MWKVELSDTQVTKYFSGERVTGKQTAGGVCLRDDLPERGLNYW